MAARTRARSDGPSFKGQSFKGQSAMSADAEAKARLLARLDGMAKLMDSQFGIPGTGIRFGLDPLISLLPGIGSVAGTGISAYLIWEARRLRLPTSLLVRMVGNVLVDFAIGAVPVAGAVADVFWRANNRNMALMRGHLAGARV